MTGDAESTACAGEPEHSASEPTSGGPAPDTSRQARRRGPRTRRSLPTWPYPRGDRSLGLVPTTDVCLLQLTRDR